MNAIRSRRSPLQTKRRTATPHLDGTVDWLGWVAVGMTEKRWTTEWIDCMVALADVHDLVMDQPNTHKPAAFDEFFPPDQARAYLDRFEFHYTPKRGSWLNMAEIEIGVLKRQCFDRRIYDAATLQSEVAAWQQRRNKTNRPIDWQFTTDDARIRLRQLYPVEIEEGLQIQS